MNINYEFCNRLMQERSMIYELNEQIKLFLIGFKNINNR